MSGITRAAEAFASPQTREKSLPASSSVVNWCCTCCHEANSGGNRQSGSAVPAMLNHQMITNGNSAAALHQITLKLATHSMLEQQFPHFYLWESCSIDCSHRASSITGRGWFSNWFTLYTVTCMSLRSLFSLLSEARCKALLRSTSWVAFGSEEQKNEQNISWCLRQMFSL